MIRALHRHFALRAAHRALEAHRLYQGQPAGAPWDVSIATAMMIKARRLSHKASSLI